MVGEGEIVDAMRFAFERLKVVIEPSGAVPLAAVLGGRLSLPPRVGVVLSGGNVGSQQFAELISDCPGHADTPTRFQ